MITLELKDCCYMCTYPALTIDTYTRNYDNGALNTNAVVKCEHSCVCEMYKHCVAHDMGQYNIKDYSTTALKD